ncbi:MAG: TIGR01459 family HAD-type hydrolase [Pseudomonadota bacterium]
MTQIIDHLSDISDNYAAVFCDLWGCLHNGITPFAKAVKALETYKASGGIVLLLTNSPRPKAGVIDQLRAIGVSDDLWGEIATSGDSARLALASGLVGQKIYHLGPDRDLGFYEPGTTDLLQGLETIERVSLEDAEGIVCTGLFNDETETPEDYNALLLEAKNRNLKFLCANPDIVVDRGDKRIYCAGALAAAYTERGGDSLYFGKPHPPIYDLARLRLTRLTGNAIPDKKILCIGDGIHTDIQGAMGEDIDALFITGGLAATETQTTQQPDPSALDNYLTQHQYDPRYSIGHLR